MDPYSRFHSEVVDARARAQRLQREAEEWRLVRQLKLASPGHSQRRSGWRSRLAAQLHALAERLEPRPDPKESSL